jgi:transcriptional regulator with XRE-family HTH domain
MPPAAAPPPAAPPAARRHELGADLRRLREARSLRLEDVATHINVVPSTLSRIETGQAPVKTRYLTAMLDLYGIDDPDERTRLVGLAKDGQPKNWWASYDDVLPAGTSRYLSLETAAGELRAYHAQAIPDLLQTPAYATAAARATRPGLSQDQAALLAAAQARRQELLHTGNCTLHLIIDHAALRRPLAPAAIMTAQIKHLAAIAADPAVTIQVTAPSPAQTVLSPSFTLLSSRDPDQPVTACYHGPAGQILLTRRADSTRAALDTFHALAQTALPPADSANLIAHLAHST